MDGLPNSPSQAVACNGLSLSLEELDGLEALWLYTGRCKGLLSSKPDLAEREIERCDGIP